jgi:AcrR family transcriptional regulator
MKHAATSRKSLSAFDNLSTRIPGPIESRPGRPRRGNIERVLTFAAKLRSMRKPASNPNRRRLPAQRRAQETVSAILDAVIRLLKRSGTSGISTNRIAEAAGVSIGSVYQYFPDKRAIFIALHDRHIEQVDKVIHRKIKESDGESLDRLISHLMDGMIEAHGSDPELSALLDSEVPDRTDAIREFSLRWHEHLRKALASHAASIGGIAKLDIRAFLLGNLLEALGHAVMFRRPAGLSQWNARIEACKAVVACLKS